MEGKKYDDGKLRYDLIDPRALAWLAGVLTFGAVKYAPENWRTVPDAANRYYAAALRHLEAWRTGEMNDPETDLPHLAHALTCVMFLVALEVPTEISWVRERVASAISKLKGAS